MTTGSEMGGKLRRNAAFDWLRRIARRFGSAREFEGVDREEIEQIARDLNLSPAELYALSSKNGPSGDLLKRRLAEFGLSQGDVRSRHPEVFRDLQRVCSNCDSTGRCAKDFNRTDAATSRSAYCPNTQTLQALEKEDLQTRIQECAAIGPCCC